MPRKPPQRRSQNYTFVIYPDSVEDGWKSRIEELGVDALISPLHNADAELGEDGVSIVFRSGKPHYHVVIIYGSVQSLAQAKEDALYIGAANGYIERVRSMEFMCKYLCHLNQKDKEKYNPAEVEVIGDYDYLGKISNSEEDDTDLLIDITAYIDSKNITSFKEFAVDCAFHNIEWFKVSAKRHTHYISALIRSNREDNDENNKGKHT